MAVEEVDERWVNGFRYIPEGCGVAQLYNLCSSDDIDDHDRGVPITGSPYGVIATDKCSAFGFLTADYAPRAERLLRAVESYYVANELWRDTLGLNPHLADPADTIVAGSASPEVLRNAIGTIEEAFYAHSPAARCMIHMTPGFMDALQHSSGGAALHRGGSNYYTQMDSVVAVDKGYPGTGPAGQAKTFSSEWIYATPVVQIRLGPIMVMPGSLAEAMDRSDNTVRYYAERAVSVSWDYNCPTIALNVKRTG